MTREELRKHKDFNIIVIGNANYIDDEYVEWLENRIILLEENIKLKEEIMRKYK